MFRILFVIPLLLNVNCFAQTVLIADHLVDVETGKMRAEPRIVIADERVSSITFGGPIPNGTLIDLSGHTLLPGLIDMHAHLTASHLEHGYKRLASSQTRAALRGVKHAKATLRAGVTTVRNLGAPGFTDVALRDAIADEDVIGPRMYVSGPSLGITGGHCDNNLLAYEFQAESEGVADGPWEAAKAVRRNIKYGADVIKICATGGVLSKGTKVGVQQYSLEEMKKIVEEAHRRGKIVAAHAHGTEGVYNAILAGVDSVEHASFIDDKGIALAKKNGLKQLSRMVEFGMSPIEAIQAASINASKLLKQEDHIGVLKAGAYADVIAVKGNPLSDISILESVQFVMKGGKTIKLPADYE